MANSRLNNDIGYVSGEQQFNPQTTELRQRLMHQQWELNHNKEINMTLADLDRVQNLIMRNMKKEYDERDRLEQELLRDKEHLTDEEIKNKESRYAQLSKYIENGEKQAIKAASIYEENIRKELTAKDLRDRIEKQVQICEQSLQLEKQQYEEAFEDYIQKLTEAQQLEDAVKIESIEKEFSERRKAYDQTREDILSAENKLLDDKLKANLISIAQEENLRIKSAQASASSMDKLKGAERQNAQEQLQEELRNLQIIQDKKLQNLQEERDRRIALGQDTTELDRKISDTKVSKQSLENAQKLGGDISNSVSGGLERFIGKEFSNKVGKKFEEKFTKMIIKSFTNGAESGAEATASATTTSGATAGATASAEGGAVAGTSAVGEVGATAGAEAGSASAGAAGAGAALGPVLAVVAVVDAIATTVNMIGNSLAKLIDPYMNTYTQYMSSIATRLQGADENYNDIQNHIRNALGNSILVTQASVIKEVQALSDSGVAFNIEQRAFLSAIADRIATTFDAANGTLLRIVRLQASDSTAARLGMEASLNSFLNSMFEDTSYLTDAFDSVTDALIEATSTMTATQSAEFEAIVQKWLGALYSVGASSSAVQSIAQGIGYLGSGNVSALSSNTTLQTMMAMSANKAGLDYAKILTEGLDISDTNDLLKAMVQYLGEIANSDNKVVKSEYANILGINMSDLNAINNLSKSNIEQIYENAQSYNSMLATLNTQINTMGERMHLSTLIDNFKENILTTLASTITQDTGKYVGYSIGNMMVNMGDSFGGIIGKATSAAGNLLRIGVIGTSLFKNIFSGSFSVANITSQIAKGMNVQFNDRSSGFSFWNREAVNQLKVNNYGTGINTGVGINSGVSESAVISNNNSNKINAESSVLSEFETNAEEVQQIIDEQQEADEAEVTLTDFNKTFEDKVGELIDNSSNILKSVRSVRNLVDETAQPIMSDISLINKNVEIISEYRNNVTNWLKKIHDELESANKDTTAATSSNQLNTLVGLINTNVSKISSSMTSSYSATINKIANNRLGDDDLNAIKDVLTTWYKDMFSGDKKVTAKLSDVDYQAAEMLANAVQGKTYNERTKTFEDTDKTTNELLQDAIYKLDDIHDNTQKIQTRMTSNY